MAAGAVAPQGLPVIKVEPLLQARELLVDGSDMAPHMNKRHGVFSRKTGVMLIGEKSSLRLRDCKERCGGFRQMPKRSAAGKLWCAGGVGSGRGGTTMGDIYDYNHDIKIVYING